MVPGKKTYGNNKNDVDFEDSVPDTINNADEILCKTYGSTELPNSFKGQEAKSLSVQSAGFNIIIIDSKFETGVVREFEEKFRKLDGTREEDVWE
ncbi:Hypothetical predicted protein [Mytilus galloprovincialis]|uniref:Uncharacterized protein n=1 Tax=Mytilus galloprovincialis TaxID=29158 RepID=A0A8B6CW41_MYTGA|nr:Hypothetical predicted protein [Mytilus galloprovincialis]